MPEIAGDPLAVKAAWLKLRGRAPHRSPTLNEPNAYEFAAPAPKAAPAPAPKAAAPAAETPKAESGVVVRKGADGRWLDGHSPRPEGRGLDRDVPGLPPGWHCVSVRWAMAPHSRVVVRLHHPASYWIVEMAAATADVAKAAACDQAWKVTRRLAPPEPMLSAFQADGAGRKRLAPDPYYAESLNRFEGLCREADAHTGHRSNRRFARPPQSVDEWTEAEQRRSEANRIMKASGLSLDEGEE